MMRLILLAGMLAPLLAPETLPAQPQTPGGAPRSQPSVDPTQTPAGGQKSKESLPEDFEPPKPPPEIMTLTKELVDDKDAKQFKRNQVDYRKALRNGERNNRTEDLIRQGIRYQVLRLSRQELREQKKLPELREEFERYIAQAGRLQNNQDVAREFRRFVMGVVVENAEKLLDNNFYVRLQAVLILSNLNVQQEDRRDEILPRAYTPAARPLVQVVQNEEQPVSVRVVAVNGLKHVLLFGDPGASLKREIASALVDDVDDASSHWWYQIALVEAIGALDLTANTSGEPFLVQALAQVLVDRKNRHWIVRATAAKSLGRVPLAPQIDVRLLTFEVVHLCGQMAQAYNENPNAFYWKECFYKVYLAFRPMNQRETRIYENPGLLTKLGNQQAVSNAYQQILPPARQVLQQNPREGNVAPLPQQTVQALAQWLKDNQPSSRKLAPDLDPLPPLQPSEEPATTSSAG